jgi:hypothetical protein
LIFIASVMGTTSASRYSGLTSDTCGLAHRTLPPQYHGFQKGRSPKAALRITAA